MGQQPVQQQGYGVNNNQVGFNGNNVPNPYANQNPTPPQQPAQPYVAPPPKVNPEVMKKQCREKVVTDLAAYRNVYCFYREVCQKLASLNSSFIVQLQVSKRGLQRATILLSYLKNEQRPNTNMVPLKSTEQDWTYFLESEDFPTVLGQVIQDCIEMRDLMEKSLAACKTTFTGNQYDSIINDNLNSDLSKHCSSACLYTVKRIKTMHDSSPNANLLKIGMFPVLVYQIETHGSKISFYYNIEGFVNGINTRPPSSFLPIIQSIANKS